MPGRLGSYTHGMDSRVRDGEGGVGKPNPKLTALVLVDHVFAPYFDAPEEFRDRKEAAAPLGESWDPDEDWISGVSQDLGLWMGSVVTWHPIHAFIEQASHSECLSALDCS